MTIRIKLLVNYGCYPIGGVDEIDNIAPEELPLSQETIQRLNAWQDVYDQTLNQDYPPLSDFSTPQAEKIFKSEGTSLWKQLRRELSPDYEVFCQNGNTLLKDPKLKDPKQILIALKHLMNAMSSPKRDKGQLRKNRLSRLGYFKKERKIKNKSFN